MKYLRQLLFFILGVAGLFLVLFYEDLLIKFWSETIINITAEQKLSHIFIYLTFLIVLWYTLETNKLRKSSEENLKKITEQITLLDDQVEEARKTIEFEQAPLISLEWVGKSSPVFKIKNIGRGPAKYITWNPSGSMQIKKRDDGRYWSLFLSPIGLLGPNNEKSINDDDLEIIGPEAPAKINEFIQSCFLERTPANPISLNIEYLDIVGRKYVSSFLIYGDRQSVIVDLCFFAKELSEEG